MSTEAHVTHRTAINMSITSRWFRPARVWLPTWRTWFLLAVVAGSGIVFAARFTYEFLSVSRPVAAKILVVEGWLPDYALADAVDAFDHGAYDLLIASGGPIERGGFLSEYEDHAALTAATLVRMGFHAERVVAVPADPAVRNRTWASAVAVRDWLAAQGRASDSINVVSLGAHARRSRAVYRKVFGNAESVGVLAVPDREVDPTRWWRTSAGMKVTVIELVGWLYETVADSGRRLAPDDAATSQPQP